MILLSRAFWQVAAERAVKNAIQVMLPVLVLAGQGDIARFGVLSGLAATVLAAGLSVVKSLAGLTADDTAPAWVRVGERGAAAAAGAVAALWPLSWDGAINADWQAIAAAAVGACVASAVTTLAGILAPTPGDGGAA